MENNSEGVVSDRVLRQLQLARMRLSSYPVLNELFKNFKDYEQLNNNSKRNMVFCSCIQYEIPLFNSNTTFMDDSQYYPMLLEELEAGLQMFNDGNFLESSRAGNFKDRLTSDDYSESESAIMEIITAYRIANKHGEGNVSLFPKVRQDKKPDIVARLKDKELFIELTSTTHRQSEQKIDRIFSKLEECLATKLQNRNGRFHIKIDTARLFEVENPLNEEKSICFLNEWFERLHIDEMWGCSGYIIFDDFYRQYEWIGKRENQEYLGEVLRAINQQKYPFLEDVFPSRERLLSWADKLSLNDLHHSPIHSIICSNSGREVRVKLQQVETPKGKIQANYDKIARTLREKIKKEQFEKGNPVLIMINIAPITIDSLELDTEVLREEVESCFVNTPFISGAIVYRFYESYGIYIQNLYADTGISLNLDEVRALGITNLLSITEAENKDESIKLKPVSSDKLEKCRNIINSGYAGRSKTNQIARVQFSSEENGEEYREVSMKEPLPRDSFTDSGHIYSDFLWSTMGSWMADGETKLVLSYIQENIHLDSGDSSDLLTRIENTIRILRESGHHPDTIFLSLERKSELREIAHGIFPNNKMLIDGEELCVILSPKGFAVKEVFILSSEAFEITYASKKSSNPLSIVFSNTEVGNDEVFVECRIRMKVRIRDSNAFFRFN
jgi:hypothetical protein